VVGGATSCLGKLERISDEGFMVERNNKCNIEQKIKKSTLPGFSLRCGKRDKSQGPPLPVKTKKATLLRLVYLRNHFRRQSFLKIQGAEIREEVEGNLWTLWVTW